MELRDIEYFDVIAEHRHLGRAAEALGLGTSALSKSLRRLENTLQVQLVRRTAKGVELTSEGVALQLHAHRLQVSLADVAREISALGQGRVGNLRIGTAAEGAGTLLGEACSNLLRDGTKVTLSVMAADSHMLLPALRSGEIDMIISPIPEVPYDDVIQEHLFDDDFVACASANHRLAKRNRVTLSDLAQERWAVTTTTSFMWRALRRAFENDGLPPPLLAMETVTPAVRLHTIASTNLLGMISRRMLREVSPDLRLAVLPYKDILWRRKLAIGYRKNAFLSPVARCFIEILRKTAKEIATARR